jgi:hypothetical protein
MLFLFFPKRRSGATPDQNVVGNADLDAVFAPGLALAGQFAPLPTASLAATFVVGASIEGRIDQ